MMMFSLDSSTFTCKVYLLAVNRLAGPLGKITITNTIACTLFDMFVRTLNVMMSSIDNRYKQEYHEKYNIKPLGIIIW